MVSALFTAPGGWVMVAALVSKGESMLRRTVVTRLVACAACLALAFSSVAVACPSSGSGSGSSGAASAAKKKKKCKPGYHRVTIKKHGKKKTVCRPNQQGQG